MKYFRRASRTSPERLSAVRRRIKVTIWLNSRVDRFAAIQRDLVRRLVRLFLRDPKEVYYETCQSGCGHSFEWFGWSDDLEADACHKIVGHDEHGEILCHHKCIFWSKS